MALSRTLKCMKTERWPLRGAFLPQGRQLWEQPWPAWQDEVIKKKDKMWSLHVERIWLHWLDQFCSQLQVLPWTPHLGKIFKKYPSAFFSLGKQLLGGPQNHYPHLTYQLLVVIVGYLWLSQLLVVINSVGYRCFLLLSFSVIGYQQCCWLSPLLLVIINAVGYHCCFLLLTYPVVGDHSLKLEKPLFALLLHKLHQTCLFHAIAVNISWNEKKWN